MIFETRLTQLDPWDRLTQAYAIKICQNMQTKLLIN